MQTGMLGVMQHFNPCIVDFGAVYCCPFLHSEKNVHVDSTNSDFTFVVHFWPIGCDRSYSLFETDIINKVIFKEVMKFRLLK